MSERGSGHIVLVSSMAGKVSNARSSIYSATKFGLRAFGFAMHEELARDGVGVTTVFPGFIRDAGMFAESGVKLPPGVGTKTPEQVAAAVLDGIENNKVEIDVAPVAMRVGARLAGAAPVLVGGLQRRLGSQKVGRALEEGQADKR
jgi:short-subunit dehydrogenase